MQIKFTKNCPPYNAGERASFNEAQGQRYIDAGSAVADDQPPAVFSVAPEAVRDVEKTETPAAGIFAKRGRK